MTAIEHTMIAAIKAALITGDCWQAEKTAVTVALIGPTRVVLVAAGPDLIGVIRAGSYTLLRPMSKSQVAKSRFKALEEEFTTKKENHD